jgi:CheY-like chemotaxis protein
VPGKDRKFTVDLGEKSNVAEGERRDSQPCEKPRILLANEDHLVRVLLQLGLERKGFDVWLACNGRDAIDLYRGHLENFDIVLLDVCMPGLDGPATLDGLREINPAVQACFTSSDTAGYKVEELLQLGAAHVFVKPYTVEDLASVLWSLARGAPADLLPSGKAC